MGEPTSEVRPKHVQRLLHEGKMGLLFPREKRAREVRRDLVSPELEYTSVCSVLLRGDPECFKPENPLTARFPVRPRISPFYLIRERAGEPRVKNSPFTLRYNSNC